MITIESIQSRMDTSLPLTKFWDNMKEVELELKQQILTTKTEQEIDEAMPFYIEFCKALVTKQNTLTDRKESERLAHSIEYYNQDMPKAFNRHCEVITQTKLYEEEKEKVARIDYLFENVQLFEKKELKKSELSDLTSYMLTKSYSGDTASSFYTEYLYKLTEIKSYIERVH